jgi:hypothetical protein
VTSTTYTATLGGTPGANPATTAAITSGKALVTVTANITAVGTRAAGVVQGFEAFAVSGATTIPASDTQSVMVGLVGSSNGSDTNQAQASATYLVTGLTNGNNTFTLNYRSSGGDTITYSNRNIIVIPLP